MDNGEDQGQGGGLFESAKQKGQEYLSDPQHQEEIKNQVRDRFGNVPGMDQVTGAMGQAGKGTESSGDQGSGEFRDQESGQDQSSRSQDQFSGGQDEYSDTNQDQSSDQSQY